MTDVREIVRPDIRQDDVTDSPPTPPQAERRIPPDGHYDRIVSGITAGPRYVDLPGQVGPDSI